MRLRSELIKFIAGRRGGARRRVAQCLIVRDANAAHFIDFKESVDILAIFRCACAQDEAFPLPA